VLVEVTEARFEGRRRFSSRPSWSMIRPPFPEIPGSAGSAHEARLSRLMVVGREVSGAQIQRELPAICRCSSRATENRIGRGAQATTLTRWQAYNVTVRPVPDQSQPPRCFDFEVKQNFSVDIREGRSPTAPKRELSTPSDAPVAVGPRPVEKNLRPATNPATN